MVNRAPAKIILIKGGPDREIPVKGILVKAILVKAILVKAILVKAIRDKQGPVSRTFPIKVASNAPTRTNVIAKNSAPAPAGAFLVKGET